MCLIVIIKVKTETYIVPITSVESDWNNIAQVADTHDKSQNHDCIYTFDEWENELTFSH